MTQASSLSSSGAGRVALPGGHLVQRISEIPLNPVLRAVIRAGSNSLEPSSEKEYLLLGYDGLGPGSDIVWDTDVSDGFDTLWRDVVLIVDPAGATRWTIVGHTPSLPYSSLVYGKITRIVVRAYLDVNDAQVAWPSIDILSICDGQSYSDTIPAEYRPSIDSLPQIERVKGQFRPMALPSILEITPPAAACTHIEITGGVRMLCKTLGYTPTADQLLADIFVYAEQARIIR